MALPTDADVIAYCRIENAAAEAALVTSVRQAAQAVVEGLVRRPLVAVARTFARVREAYDPETGDGVLFLPGSAYPVASVTSVVDADGATVPGADYALDVRTGRITATALTSKAWTNGAYTVTAVVGLSAHPEYATLIEPRLRLAILLAAADAYANRNPRASSETAAGAGVGLTADAEQRVRSVLGDLVPARGRVLV